MHGCPHKLTHSVLKAPGTPHSWPPLLSVLHWLTVLAQVSDAAFSSNSGAPPDDLKLYTTQGYRLFLSGDDDAVDALDEEYSSKARMNGEAADEANRALEVEEKELEAEANRLTSGPSRLEALEAEIEAFTADVHKFKEVVKIWTGKINEKEDVLVASEKELEAKVMDGQRIAAENQELLKKVEVQAVNVRDADRMQRELQAVERDIANVENAKATLEDKVWELEAALVRKLEEIEVLAEQCNQAPKRSKPSIDFQYTVNVEGSSPAEILGIGYKAVLKPAIKARDEENKRVTVSSLEESVDLQKQLQVNVRILEEKRNSISSLQVKDDKMNALLNSLDREIVNDDSRCKTDTRQKEHELKEREHLLNAVQKEAEEFFKNSEKRLQDAIKECDEETQARADELMQLADDIAEYKDFMEGTIAQRKKDLYETADYIASLASNASSSSPSKKI